MHIGMGSEVIAPEGLNQLKKGEVYYFLRSRAAGVLLVHFEQAKDHSKPNIEPPRPRLITLPRTLFEESLAKTKPLLEIGTVLTMPPWLAHLEGMSLTDIDEGRRDPVLSHTDRMKKRLDFLQSALEQVEGVLNSKNPNLQLNKFAAACIPKQNPSRFRSWFFTYLTFGRNPLSLHYNTSHIGKWDRQNTQPTAKLGAPSLYGTNHGNNVTSEMDATIKLGYEKLACFEKDKKTIYGDVLKRNFGCKIRRDENNYKTYYHPQGLPFPTERQFWYTIQKHYPDSEVQKDLLGPTRVRSDLALYIGAFSESVCNLLERVEADAYVLKDRPRGLIEGTALKPLTVVRIRCVASGVLIGIGFSLGGERASAYRMALFCAAVEKVEFCRLFGIKINIDDWPGAGLPPHVVVDRGPGSGLQALSLDPSLIPTIRSLSPAYSGQSKATIESSHPKKRKNLEAPEYRLSKLTAIEMARREIRRTVKDNDSMDVSDRLTPDLLNTLRKHTPIALWTELERRGRNDSVPITFSAAVRAFLEQHKATLTRYGVEFLGRRYRHEGGPIHEAGIRVGALSHTNIKVYVLPACVRHIWMDIGSQLITLDLILPLRSQTGEFFMSLLDLQAWDVLDKKHRAARKMHRIATAQSAEDDFEKETGKQWGSGAQRKGKAPRQTQAVQVEMKESKRDFQT